MTKEDLITHLLLRGNALDIEIGDWLKKTHGEYYDLACYGKSRIVSAKFDGKLCDITFDDSGLCLEVWERNRNYQTYATTYYYSGEFDISQLDKMLSIIKMNNVLDK